MQKMVFKFQCGRVSTNTIPGNGAPYAPSIMSGISAVGGALGTIPHPGAQLAGGALSIAPTVGRKLSEYTYNVFGNPKVQD